MKRLSLFIGGATAAIVVYAVLALGGGGVGVAHAEFVCPVTPISSAAVANANPGVFSLIGEGDYSNLTTILEDTGASDPANNRVTEGVPDDMSGDPDGIHADPGDSTYTAIWDDGAPSGATKNPQD